MSLRKFVPLAAFATFAITSCGDDEPKSNDTPTETISDAGVDAVLPAYAYKRLEGSIAGQAVVMHLQKAGEYINCMYYYKKQGKWILLLPVEDNTQTDFWIFEEYAPQDAEARQNITPARIEGRYANGAFTGKWISGDSVKQFDFSLKDSYPQGSYQFSTMGLRDSAIAFTNKKESPVGRISKYFPIAVQHDDATWINTQLRRILYLEQYGNIGLEEAAKKDFARYLSEYKAETAELINSEFTAILNYESTQEVSIRYNEHSMIIFESKSYDYEGGAHGNFGSAMYCFDVANKKQLKLSDITTADSTQLQTLLEKHFRIQSGLTNGQKLTEILFENQLLPNDNFYFSNQGLGFIYNPYEVAAYAYGQINVFIPFSDLKPYLNPNFARRMQIK